ncbi:hypothetical protein CEQ90_06435 [Lewinellaceae bacterium SD302]|nr:hypothetical protein CEQ90_06435 [Lewinellaceae bacterium SD302]
MSTRIYLFLLLLFFVACLHAQTEPAEREVSIEGIEHVSIRVNYSSVYLKSGNTATLKSEHIVKIDGKDQPDLRELDIRREGKTLYVEELKPTVDLLEKRYPEGFQSERGNVVFGKSVVEIEKGDVPRSTLETNLIITLPESVTVEVKTVYGSITARDIGGLTRAYAEYGSLDVHISKMVRRKMKLESQYGKVDLSLPVQFNADLLLRTEYGSLYTDLDIAVDADASRQGDFLEELVGQLGSGGELISCSAPYGNVYLRKL